ncbi:MAG: helix-turn-helix domain-containing protein [Solirubrobacteraceae bacterium]
MPASHDPRTVGRAPGGVAGGRGARERILAAARELFYRQGINVTGVTELCAVARVSKRTLYQHFAGKDEVVAAYVGDLAADPAYAPHAVLTRGDLAPRARLLELYGTLADGRRPLRGCPFVNAGIELADPAHPARLIAAAYKAEFADRLSALAREAGARGSERVGRRLALLYDGAAAQVALTDRPEPATEAQAFAAALLQAAAD